MTTATMTAMSATELIDSLAKSGTSGPYLEAVRALAEPGASGEALLAAMCDARDEQGEPAVPPLTQEKARAMLDGSYAPPVAGPLVEYVTDGESGRQGPLARSVAGPWRFDLQQRWDAKGGHLVSLDARRESFHAELAGNLQLGVAAVRALAANEAARLPAVEHFRRLRQRQGEADRSAALAKARVDELVAKRQGMVLAAAPGLGADLVALDAELAPARKQLATAEAEVKALVGAVADARKGLAAGAAELVRKEVTAYRKRMLAEAVEAEKLVRQTLAKLLDDVLRLKHCGTAMHENVAGQLTAEDVIKALDEAAKVPPAPTDSAGPLLTGRAAPTVPIAPDAVGHLIAGNTAQHAAHGEGQTDVAANPPGAGGAEQAENGDIKCHPQGGAEGPETVSLCLTPGDVGDGSGPPAQQSDEGLVAQFLAERCSRDPEGRAKVRADKLYAAYVAWSEARGTDAPLSQKKFGEIMGHVPGLTKIVSDGVRYCGLQLLPTGDEPQAAAEG